MEEILIDGYHILLEMPYFSKLVSSEGPEKARDELIRKLEGYQKTSGRKVRVIFDESLASSYEKSGETSGISVLFTNDNQDVASLIKTFIKRRKHKGSVGVVTPNRKLAEAVKKLGARYLNNFDFLENKSPVKGGKVAPKPNNTDIYGKIPIVKTLDRKSLIALKRYRKTLKHRTKTG